ncbi:MAG: nitroreductase family protein [Succinivibrionaceae bacterium]|nr:nitroreductase family protein [Succinivibrionaceae bacterium]
MGNFLRVALAAAGVLALGSAQAGGDWALPSHVAVGSTPTLAEVLERRHSAAEFSEAQISTEQLSFLMWSGCGENRPELHKRTAASARNLQEIHAYAVMEDGAYEYLPREHQLRRVANGDLRRDVAATQPDLARATLAVVLVADLGTQDNELVAGIDAGIVAENLMLAAAALGLGARPRITMDDSRLAERLGLPSKFRPIMNVVIGKELR